MEIEVVVFVVHGQSLTLSDCMDPFVDNFCIHGWRPEILVVDSASGPVQRNVLKGYLSSVHRRYGLDVWYSSERETDAFLDRANSEHLRYALKGDPSTGVRVEAVLNRGLLAVAGRSALFIDACTDFAIAGAPGGSNSLRVKPRVRTGRFDPYRYESRTVEVFKNEAELEGKTPVLRTFDTLGFMGEHLGKSFGEVARGFDEVLGSAKGTVHISTLGIWGDPNVTRSTYYALTEGMLADDLAPDSETYAQLARSRFTKSIAKNWFVSRGGALSRGMFAVGPDWSSAPFFPAGQSSTGQTLPGLLASLCSPDELMIEAPLGVRRVTQVLALGSMDWGAERMSLHDLLFVLIEMCSGSGGLSMIGGGLEAAASLGDSEFDLLMRNSSRIWARQMGGRVSKKLTAYAGSSSDFRADMERVLQVYSGIAESGDSQFKGSMVRRQLAQYGGLLSSWDETVDLVASLRKSGVEIGIRL